MEFELKYELINITFDIQYEVDDVGASPFACEELPTNKATQNEEPIIDYDSNGVPKGRTRMEIKIREKMIKDFYAKWISEHPDKSITNRNLKAKTSNLPLDCKEPRRNMSSIASQFHSNRKKAIPQKEWLIW